MKRASSRSLARFKRAAALYHGAVISAQWEPLGVHMDFDGPTGGWYIQVKWRTGYTDTCIGLSIAESLNDIEYHGAKSLRYLKQPDITIPKTEEQWKALAHTLYQDTRSLMNLEARATALRPGDTKGAWVLVNELRAQDAKRLADALKATDIP